MHPLRELATFIVVTLKLTGIFGVLYGAFMIFAQTDPTALVFGFMLWIAGWGLDTLLVAIFGLPPIRSNL